MLRYKLGFSGLLVCTLGCAAWIVALIGQADLNELSPDQSAATQAQDSLIPSTVQSGDSERSRIVPSAEVPEEAQRARVVGHVDGDTIHLVPLDESEYLSAGEETRVRLLEIDTPESVDPSSPTECYSLRSSRALSEMLPLGADVWTKPDRDLLDPYGRTLLYLWTEDGRFVNLDMVRSGFATAVLFEPNDEYIDVMRRAERQARQANRGMWGACEYFGQPRGFTQLPNQPVAPAAEPSPKSESGTDPRFRYCSDANDAGYGNYVSGRDLEYDWYEDRDSDGVVCEY